ncbi:MAG TPA: D-aminoacylase [Verrucomicrobiota bacterium]|nr:D-aminoacylase [Verrucomicrobiota bacterium]HNT14747.1 D-aminoacylase [Verrucomicrobiota bacterium]
MNNRLLGFLLLGFQIATGADYDCIIRHGRIVDGTGAPAYFADVAIKSGRIARIGRLPGRAEREIDAQGLIVAPGFIDVHTHADEIAARPRAENFLRMGVTTLVVGNCGDSALDVGQFFAAVTNAGITPNVATLIGHNTVREKAMGGSFDRAPTAQEMARMKDYVARAMRDGAVGLSTGLIYLPGTFSKPEEIIELAKVIAPYDGIYASHMRHEGAEIRSALDEVFRVAREAGVRAEISHLKLSGENAWGRADAIIADLEAARARGLDITADQYAYTASSTTLRQLIPEDVFDGGQQRFLALLKNPDEKAALVKRMKRRITARGRRDYAYAVIASYGHDPSLNGLNLVEAAKKGRGNDSLDDQIETILEIQRQGGASGVFHSMNEADLQTFMRYPNTMVASDSGIREFGKGVPHPRGYGNNARVLARYVRELKVLRLEEAIRKMTSLPATTFRLKNRGLLKDGFWADLTLFDPQQVQDRATFRDPHHYATGIPFVLVNGVVVVAQGELTDARPGRGLKLHD